MSIVNVKEIVENRTGLLKNEVTLLKEYGIVPKLAVILANNEASSRSYISQKRKMCQKIGIEQTEYEFGKTSTTEDIVHLITSLNYDSQIDGILVQLPLFEHIDEQVVLNSINPLKDVDGFGAANIGNLFNGAPAIIPCTPKGILTVLKEISTDIAGKHAVIVGRSRIVGRPLFSLLIAENTTVTVCHSKTENLELYTQQADILIVATGQPHLITASMVKPNSIVIDVGITKVDGKLIGDVDTIAVSHIAKYITPVPGGIGLTTVLSLMENVIKLCKQNKFNK